MTVEDLEALATRLGFLVFEVHLQAEGIAGDVGVAYRVYLAGTATDGPYSYFGTASACRTWLEGWEMRAAYDGYSR